VISLHTLSLVGGITMGGCEGECWGMGSGDLPAHPESSGRATMGGCEGECWGWGQVISLHTLSPVGGATMGGCEGECWGMGSEWGERKNGRTERGVQRRM
jgi:hypothetical protein